jgi:molecular chaperone DnaK (HSP70)
MIQSERIDEIREFYKAGTERILKAFGEDPKKKVAETITKADLDDQFPIAEYERYSVSSLHKFREDLTKGLKDAELEKANADFVAVTSGLKVFQVVHEGVKDFVFTRKKEVGEK